MLIPRPDSWLPLARENGSLPGRDRHTELPKTLRTIPTYSVYGTIARLLRASPESGLFLMAEARWQRVGCLPSVMAFVAQATHPAGALLRDRQPAA